MTIKELFLWNKIGRPRLTLKEYRAEIARRRRHFKTLSKVRILRDTLVT